jgi:hypothetical protein
MMYPADILAEMEAFFKKFIEMQFTVVGSDLLPVVGGNLIYRASGGCALHDAVRSVMFWSVQGRLWAGAGELYAVEALVGLGHTAV